MTLKIHMSIHNDDLHKGSAKRNVADGVAGLDSGGLLDTTKLDVFQKKYTISSVSIQHHDTEVDSYETVYTKKKTITIDILHPSPSIIKTYFELRSPDSVNVYGRIYKNGIAFGTERIMSNVAWTSYYEDLSFVEGDTLEVYIKTSNAVNPVEMGDLRIKGTIIDVDFQISLEDQHVGLNVPFQARNS